MLFPVGVVAMSVLLLAGENMYDDRTNEDMQEQYEGPEPEECEACGGTGMGPQTAADDYDKCKQCNGSGQIDPEEGMYFDYDGPDYPDLSTYRDNSGY